MADENEKRSVEQQLADAKEHVKYSGETEGVPDFTELQKARANFIVGKEPDAETFKNEREAFDALNKRAEESATEEKAAAEETAAAEQKAFDADVAATRQWDEQETQVIGAARERVAEFRAKASEFTGQQAKAEAALAELEQVNPALAAQARAARAAYAQELAAERDALLGAESAVRQAIAKKQIFAERKKLERDIPELQDPENRKALVEWARGYGLSDQELSRAAHDPGVVRRAWKEFQNQKAEKRRERIGDEIESAVGYKYPEHDYRGPRSSAEAAKRLKASGRIDDAVSLLRAKRLERRAS